MNHRDDLTRRQFLALLGIGGAGIATAGVAAWIGLHLLARRSNDRLLEALATDAAATNQAPTPVSVPRPTIVPRAEWGAAPPNHTAANESGFYHADGNPYGWYAYPPPLAAIYTTVVIHHAAFYEADDLDTLHAVQYLHQVDRGWADVGYHYLVGRSGTIFAGRPINVRGTHTGGYNTGTAGVCLLGNFMEQYPTEPQVRAAQDLVTWLAADLALTHLAGHFEFNKDTECPGTNLIPYLDVLAAGAGLARGTEGYAEPDQD